MAKPRKGTTSCPGNIPPPLYAEKHTGPPALAIDYEKYAKLIDNADLSEKQKQEFIQAIWNVVVEFVSLGFGVHPIQRAKNSCGKSSKKLPQLQRGSSHALDSNSIILNEDLLAAVDPDGHSAAGKEAG